MKDRVKWFLKLGQVPTPEQATEQTGPTTVPGEPTAAGISTYFPSFIKAWGSENLSPAQQIIDIINHALFILSSGQMDFNKLRVVQFVVDPSKYPDAVIANIVRFSQLLYNHIITNNGQTWNELLSKEDRKFRISQLVQNITSSNIPAGPLNNFLRTKIGGSFKEMIINSLSLIK